MLLLRYFWLAVIFFILGLAIFWRLEANDRIVSDPSLKKPLNRLYSGFAFWTSLPFLLMGLGILTGNVESVFHYLVLGTDKSFVIASQVFLFALDVLFIYWVFFRDGDQLIALHTELVQDRPKLRVAVKGLAIAIPIVQCLGFYQATFSPHFGQWLGAQGA